ncbi:MAG: suppressor of fused domain protein [Phycisphaerales bacterium]|nr:suppressor of fused domain protein [Phycisphaerales bacterium]
MNMDYRSELLEYVSASLGKPPTIVERANAAETWSIGIAKFAHSPSAGLATHATIGLGEQEFRTRNASTFPAKIELIGITELTTVGFDRVLAAIAFDMVRTGQVRAPGQASMDVVGEAIPGVTVPHAFGTDPYLWQGDDHNLEEFRYQGNELLWLMIVPISDGELELLRRHGEEALVERLERANVNVADLWRPSCV